MFDLAVELGGMTVEWLKTNMSGYELSQWLVYYQRKADKADRYAGKIKPTRENLKVLFGKKA